MYTAAGWPTLMGRTKLFHLHFFFFQAEDGIRDHCVTGVQTCALPICLSTIGSISLGIAIVAGKNLVPNPAAGMIAFRTFLAIPSIVPRLVDRATNPMRSEERRVGKECRSRWSPYH